MPTIRVHYAAAPRPMPSTPGLKVEGTEITEFAMDVPPIRTGDDLTHVLNTMAKMVGRLQSGQAFKIDVQRQPRGVGLCLFLSDDPNGPKIFTADPLDVDERVLDEWRKRNVMPPTTGPAH